MNQDYIHFMQQVTLEVLKINIWKKQNCRSIIRLRQDNGEANTEYGKEIHKKDLKMLYISYSAVFIEKVDNSNKT